MMRQKYKIILQIRIKIVLLQPVFWKDMRYFIHLAYNGSAFFGWQIQPNHPSVQETLENCLSLLLHEERVAVTGCGRTDTGVHASSFFAHFDTEKQFSPEECQQLVQKLNSFLPKEIVIFDLFEVAPDLHARFDAESRTYQYHVCTCKNPFKTEFTYHCHRAIDVDKMNEAATLLLQNEDFTSFSKVHTQVNNFICHVTEAHWDRVDDELIFTVTANRFLRNMVRALVGTLLEVGFGKLTVQDFQNIINQKDRRAARTSAPANALFLTEVRYPRM